MVLAPAGRTGSRAPGRLTAAGSSQDTDSWIIRSKAATALRTGTRGETVGGGVGVGEMGEGTWGWGARWAWWVSVGGVGRALEGLLAASQGPGMRMPIHPVQRLKWGVTGRTEARRKRQWCT
jgi:hypothetical protein